MKTSFWRHWWQSIRQAKPARPISREGTRRRTLLLEKLEDRTLLSGNPYMLLDTNPATFPSDPRDLVAIGSTTYFSAYDGIHGRELYKSDGTAAGTGMVVDFGPGINPPFSDPSNLTNINGTLFFTSGNELWKSDGTAAGTVLVKDIGPGSGERYPENLTNVNGILYFAANDGFGSGGHGTELWKSDGTTAGTLMLRDINPGGASSYPFDLTNVNGTLFFTANDGTSVAELWKSDGTAASTVLVKDINPGSTYLYLGHLTAVRLTGGNDTLFFHANDGVHGTELWKSDGTTAGTLLVKDINPGSGSSYPRGLTNVNGTLYFDATGAIPGDQLWKSDGTTAGTTLVTAVPSLSYLTMTNVNGTLFFSADSSTGQAVLWKSNGTAAGTIPLGSSRLDNVKVTNVNGAVFFSGFNSSNGQELWKSDGTAAGTVLVKDIDPGSTGSYPRYLANVNGTLLFSADDGIHGHELWKSDGTAAGTVLVKDINSTSYPAGQASDFTSVGGTTFFVADDGTVPGLWKSDGTTAGTTFVKDFSTSPSYLTSLNGRLFFAADGGLWKSDGTTAGTTVVSSVAVASKPANVNGTLFFAGNDGGNGTELWKSDGTVAGTTLVKDIFAGTHIEYFWQLGPNGYYGDYPTNVPNSSNPTNLTNVNGVLYFTANEGTDGQELWKSDGTAAGTVLVADINPGTAGSYPAGLTNLNGTLYFAANDGTDGDELWKSDGTAAGTGMVKDINPGSAGSYAGNLTNVNGALFFTANDGTDGAGLWRSDGSAAGTVMVKDINPDSAGSNPGNLTNVNGTLFFSATDGVKGVELWESNGTAAGTTLVKDIYPGNAGSNPASLTNVNGVLYFAASDGTSGVELWQSDGTAASTTLVKDIYPGSTGSYPANLTNSNGTLFFGADDGVHGPEPWVLPGAATTPAAASLAVSAFPSSTTAGVPGSFTVTAKNTDGTPATGYTGTVHFTTSDGQAGLPADYLFTAADAGVHTFSAILRTAGTQSLTATDTTTASVSGSEGGITVTPAAASQLAVSAAAGSTAGSPFSVTLTARDRYNNLTTYTGSVHFTSSDGQASLPGDYTFTAADAGVHTFTNGVILKTASNQTVTASDTVTSSMTGSAAVTISPAAARTLIVAGFPAPTTAGVAGNLTVTLKDLYGNLASGYSGTVHVTSSDAKAALPANYTFTAADAGVHTFSATLKTAGTQSLTATDTTTGSLTGTDGGITVKPAAASQFIITAPSKVSAGVAFSLTVTVKDAYGNVVTGYTGTIHFSSTDNKATLPSNYTFTASDKGVHTFTGLVLRKKGTQKITITDTLNSALTASVIENVG